MKINENAMFLSLVRLIYFALERHNISSFIAFLLILYSDTEEEACFFFCCPMNNVGPSDWTIFRMCTLFQSKREMIRAHTHDHLYAARTVRARMMLLRCWQIIIYGLLYSRNFARKIICSHFRTPPVWWRVPQALRPAFEQCQSQRGGYHTQHIIINISHLSRLMIERAWNAPS